MNTQLKLDLFGSKRYVALLIGVETTIVADDDKDRLIIAARSIGKMFECLNIDICENNGRGWFKLIDSYELTSLNLSDVDNVA